MTDMIGKKVVVTTSHRGVFFGTLAEENADSVTLTGCRNCIYWSAKTKGFLGLTSHGPQAGSRVGPAAKRAKLIEVTSITECADEAITAWEAEPWS